MKKLNNEEPVKEYWIFLQYHHKDMYPIYPFRVDIFEDFNKMKIFSGLEATRWKKLYTEYCSTYARVENL